MTKTHVKDIFCSNFYMDLFVISSNILYTGTGPGDKVDHGSPLLKLPIYVICIYCKL